jgi:hypothetical protein
MALGDTNIAAGADPIFDHHRLAKPQPQPLANPARKQLRYGGWRRSHHDGHRLDRAILPTRGRCWRGEDEQGGYKVRDGDLCMTLSPQFKLYPSTRAQFDSKSISRAHNSHERFCESVPRLISPAALISPGLRYNGLPRAIDINWICAFFCSWTAT